MAIPRLDRIFTILGPVLLFTLAPTTVLTLSLHAAKLVLVAGGADAPATTQLREPFGIEFNSAGNGFIIEMARGNRLLRLDAKTGALTHLAGQAAPGNSGDGGPALRARFNGPHNLAVHPDGHVFIADTWNGRIRVYDPAIGLVTSLAGYGVPAAQGRANGPYCVALNPAATHLYIADLRRIHALDLATGQLVVIAGNGEKGIPADGDLATAAPLVDPRAVAVDRHGHVYILERNGHALRVVTPDGRIRTVVNVAGKKGATGDGGDARLAALNGPKHLCLDRDDSVLIADAENNLIRRYVPATGKILRVAGTGQKGAAGLDGPPDQAELARPHGVTIHRDGTLYITDSYNDRILKIMP